jgi:microcystin-dependent protein
MGTPFLGEVKLTAFTYPPKGWAFCEGQTLAISQNTALFSLLGTTYGGNGINTFQLPDLRDRAILSSGQGPGLSNYTLGQVGGEINHSLTTQEIPQHTHTFAVAGGLGTSSSPLNKHLGTAPMGIGYMYHSATDGSAMEPDAMQASGSSQAHDNLMPTMGMCYIIALQGIFPSRN